MVKGQTHKVDNVFNITCQYVIKHLKPHWNYFWHGGYLLWVAMLDNIKGWDRFKEDGKFLVLKKGTESTV